MLSIETSIVVAVVAALVIMLIGATQMRRKRPRTAPYNLPECKPEATRVLTAAERQGLALLKQAAPGHLALAQVPLSRFLRVPPAWVPRIASLSADLLLCDSASRVLVVIDIRTARLSEVARRRHERMSMLLRNAGIKVLNWQDNELPDPSTARRQLLAVLPAMPRESATAVTSRPMPLIPVAEVLAEGDAEHDDRAEPVPSAMFEDYAVER